MYIGIDLGTSSVKLILVTEQGEIVGSATRSYELFIPLPSCSEQLPEDWFDKTMDGLKSLVQGHQQAIKAISFSGQMHGMVILDRDDHVIRPAILWNDQRTVREVEELNNVLGIETLLKETGNIALTGLTAPKILWVKHHEKDHFDQIEKVMLPKDYLIYKLSGEFATDVSDVSGTLYYNVKEKCYSQTMLQYLGLEERHFPKVYESFDVVGHLKQEIKDVLGFKHDVKIIAGGGDQAVGAVGIGTVNDGECSISLGTSGVVFVSSDHFKVDKQSYLQSYCHSNGKYHLMGVILNAAGAIKWWSEYVFQNYNYADFYQKLEQSSVDDDLYFLPYLTGERSPINDPKARGVFFGLRLEHRKEHMDRAVVEGVTFALRETFDLIKALGVPIQKVKLTGGGAKSPIWAQMIAHIMNVEVVTLTKEEGPAFGAAILAMVGDGIYPSVSSATLQLIKENESYQPEPSMVELYERKYHKFRKIYPALKHVF